MQTTHKAEMDFCLFFSPQCYVKYVQHDYLPLKSSLPIPVPSAPSFQFKMMTSSGSTLWPTANIFSVSQGDTVFEPHLG